MRRWPRWRSAGFICLAGLALALSASTASATFPGANGRIAYSAEHATDSQFLHTVLPSGHGDTPLSPAGYGPAWSPNGKRLAFTGYDSGGGTDVYSMRADGTDVRRLTENAGYHGGSRAPSYSPGGGRIVFLAEGYHAPTTITTMRTDGSDVHYLHRTGDPYHYPVWSPSGEIAYVEPGKRLSIWTMHPNGSDNHRLVYLGKSGGYGPIYSPDGSKFLFVRYRADGGVATRVADADGSNVRAAPCRILSSGTVGSGLFPAESGVFPVAYSPDSKWLLVKRYNGSQPSDLLRLSLASCKGARVVSGAARNGPEADWQSLPGG